MVNFLPILRYRLLTSHELKNVIGVIEKTKVYDLVKYQHCYCRKIHFTCTLQKENIDKGKSDIVKSEKGPSSEISSETIIDIAKEGTKTVWYGSIVLAGLGVTGIIIYVLFNELFSSNSPNNVYSRALDRCAKDDNVIRVLGEPIKGYGEENGRGRRRHVSHLVYEKDGVNYMRMKFYVKGRRNRGTVNLEMKENDRGKYDYRYLFVQLDEYPYTTIVLEDNRQKSTLTPLPTLSDSPDLLN